VTFLVREGNSELVRSMKPGERDDQLRAGPSLAVFDDVLLPPQAVRSRSSASSSPRVRVQLSRSLLALLARAKIRIGYSGEHSYPFVNCEIRVSTPSLYEGASAEVFSPRWGSTSDRRFLAGRSRNRMSVGRQLRAFPEAREIDQARGHRSGDGQRAARLVDESFTFLVNQISRRLPSKVMILSNNLDSKRLELFRSRLRTDCLDLQPKNAKEGIALLSCADLLLAGNTDYFHFAVSMRIRR